MEKIHRKYLNKFCLSIIFVLFLGACSSTPFKSGKYVKIREGDTLKTLAKDFKVPSWMIEKANEGREFKAGNWYYVPLIRGIVGTVGFDNIEKVLATDNFTWPVPTHKRMSSGYGGRWGKNHNGIDIPAPIGTKMVSVADGVVVYSDNGFTGFGNLTVIAHRYGLYSVYGHADKNFTKKGDKVKKGQLIANVGNTGKSTGPHLHFEMRWKGRALNPVGFFEK